MKRLILVLSILAAIGAAGSYYFQSVGSSNIEFRTGEVKRGDLVVTISATGTVEPEEVIDVGAQVAGRILVFGTDAEGKPVDYGTPVEENMVLARIDDSLYRADLDQALAQLEAAKADVLRNKADLEQMRARLVQAERNWKRAQELGPSRALSATDYDSYQAAYETAKATVAVGEAAVVQAEKSVAQAQALVNRAQTNYSFCTIRSPVKGVIIDRRVNIGQTVVASLNAPSLFLIAKDLRRMQVWVAVNEADIGQIHPGQKVRFTVDAFPDEVFEGYVGKIRLNASMVQNVVNYTVEVVTDNSSGRLLPYLTANVEFEVARRENVLQVPRMALRWLPSRADLIVPELRDAYADRTKEAGANSVQPRRGVTTRPSKGLVWVEENGLVRPIEGTVGLSDGTMTEFHSDDLREGMRVVVAEVVRTSAQTETRNPFAPQFRRSSSPRGGR